jgi:hypothetical protein
MSLERHFRGSSGEIVIPWRVAQKSSFLRGAHIYVFSAIRSLIVSGFDYELPRGPMAGVCAWHLACLATPAQLLARTSYCQSLPCGVGVDGSHQRPGFDSRSQISSASAPATIASGKDVQFAGA